MKSLNKFSTDWNSLYNIRNKVAHGKTIEKDDYAKALELIENFKCAFEECLAIIDTLEMTKEESNAVEEVAKQVISPTAGIYQNSLASALYATDDGKVYATIPRVSRLHDDSIFSATSASSQFAKANEINYLQATAGSYLNNITSTTPCTVKVTGDTGLFDSTVLSPFTLKTGINTSSISLEGSTLTSYLDSPVYIEKYVPTGIKNINELLETNKQKYSALKINTDE